MTDELEDHRCRSGKRCVNADVDVREIDPETNKPLRRGAVIADGQLCAGCMFRLGKSVRALTDDYERLAAVIGENHVAGGDKVHLTQEAVIPINVATEALMSRIVETATRGAEMVADAMNMGWPVWPANPRAALTKAVRILEPTLAVLVEVGPQAAFVWARVPSGDDGWDVNGQPTELVDLSGVDVAVSINEINRLVGVQLGKAKLRYQTWLPCPAWDTKAKRYCGAFTVGRDDGADLFDCETCGTTWTEAEYGLLTGLLLGEIEQLEENNMLRWLLAEAYGRLDEMQAMVARLDGDPAAELPGAGPLILARIEQILEGHQPPEERNPGTEPKKKRQKAIAAPTRKAIES